VAYRLKPADSRLIKKESGGEVGLDQELGGGVMMDWDKKGAAGGGWRLSRGRGNEV